MRKVLAVFLVVLVGFGGVARADQVVIAALGDSLTQGYGLMRDDGFVPQLQGWLDAQGADVRLINAGVSGDTTAGGLARVAWTLEPEVDAMIVALGGNDMLRGLDPVQARSNIKGILQAASEADVEVLLIGMQSPGNYGPEYKAAFDGLYPELAKEYGVVFLESFFWGLNDDGAPADPAALREWFQADGIHPNRAGVARIVDAVGPKVMTLIGHVDAGS